MELPWRRPLKRRGRAAFTKHPEQAHGKLCAQHPPSVQWLPLNFLVVCP